MSRFRKIDVRIWNDAKFRALSDDGKLVFVLLLTHPSQTSLGAMPATSPGLAHTLNWLPDRFAEGLGELLENGMAEADEEAGLICLPRFLRFNPPENQNVVKAWAGSVDMLPECELKTRTMQRAYACVESRGQQFVKAFVERFGIPSPNGIANGMANQEQEPEPEPEPKKARGSGGSELSPTHAKEREAPAGNLALTPEEEDVWLKNYDRELESSGSEFQAKRFAADQLAKFRSNRPAEPPAADSITPELLSSPLIRRGAAHAGRTP